MVRRLGIPIVLLIFLSSLLLLGRSSWCQCGSWQLWVPETASSHTSQHLVDPYSFSHVQHGILFFGGMFLLSKYFSQGRFCPTLWLALAIETAWEVLENTSFIIERYRATTISLDYYGDSIGNSFGDLLCCAFGFFLASRFRWQATLLLYVAIEFGMLLTYRDSLCLNVIMLIAPVDAIRQWQGG